MSSSKFNIFLSTTFCFLAVLAGFKIQQNYLSQFDSLNYTMRAPSNTLDMDSTDVSETQIELNIKKKIIQGIKNTETNGQIGLELGGFYYQIEQERKFACDRFPRIILIFEAEGMATSGDKPQMEIDGPCYITEKGQIGATLISVTDIINRVPFEGEISLNEENGSYIRFFNLDDEWPQTWALVNIYLENNEGVSEIEITTLDLMKNLNYPLGLSFTLPEN